MMYSRTKRTKTEFEKPKRKYFPSDSENPSNRQTPQPSISSNGRQSVVSRALKDINHEINYELLTTDQIAQESNVLRNKIKEMNARMARLVEKEMERRHQQDRINQKSIINRQMGMNYDQVNKEYIENVSKIEQLQDQYKESNDKLKLLSDPYSKMNLIQKIAETQLKVKQIKEQLGRIKKNKFIRERQIIKGVKKDKGEQIQNLQVEYITYNRKSQQLMTRSDQVQTELTDSELKVMKQKDYYEELKEQLNRIEEKQEMTPTMKEHYSLLYKSHKKKLELHMKRNQREQEGLKRKYYNMLLEFKSSKNRLVNVEHTIHLKQKDNEQAYEYIKLLTQKLKNLSNKTQQSQTQKSSEQCFMMTEIPKEKVFIKRRVNTESVQPIEAPKEQRVMNSPKQSRVRRWNNRAIGSIKRQQSSINKQMMYSFSGNSPSQTSNRNKYHSLNNKIHENTHFYTEGDDRNYQNSSSQLSNVVSQSEEAYPSDFEG